MTKIGLQERREFLNIIKQDMHAINSKVVEQLKELWEESRIEILQETGLDILQHRKEEIMQQMVDLKEELNKLEVEITSAPLNVHQAIELGGDVDRWGKVQRSSFFGMPVRSQLDYDVVQRIKEKVDTEAPAKYLRDLGRTALRELTMAGTFEECQQIYADFYSLDFRKYGVDIPPRLSELRKAKEAGTEHLLGYVTKPKQLPENTEKEKKDDHDNMEVA